MQLPFDFDIGLINMPKLVDWFLASSHFLLMIGTRRIIQRCMLSDLLEYLVRPSFLLNHVNSMNTSDTIEHIEQLHQ